MAAAILVDADVEMGRELLRILDEAKFPVTAAACSSMAGPLAPGSRSEAVPWHRSQANRVQSSSHLSTSTATPGSPARSRTRASSGGSAARLGFPSRGE